MKIMSIDNWDDEQRAEWRRATLERIVERIERMVWKRPDRAAVFSKRLRRALKLSRVHLWYRGDWVFATKTGSVALG